MTWFARIEVDQEESVGSVVQTRGEHRLVSTGEVQMCHTAEQPQSSGVTCCDTVEYVHEHRPATDGDGCIRGHMGGYAEFEINCPPTLKTHSKVSECGWYSVSDAAVYHAVSRCECGSDVTHSMANKYNESGTCRHCGYGPEATDVAEMSTGEGPATDDHTTEKCALQSVFDVCSTATDTDLMSTNEEATDSSGGEVGVGEQAVVTMECVTCGESDPCGVSEECAGSSVDSDVGAPDCAHVCAMPMFGVCESAVEVYCCGRRAGAALGGPYEAVDCTAVVVDTDPRSVNCSEAADGCSMGRSVSDAAIKQCKSEVSECRVVESGTFTECIAVTGDGVNDTFTTSVVGMGTVPRVKFKMCVVVLYVTDECNSTSVSDATDGKAENVQV